MKSNEILSAAAAAIGGFLGYFIGGLDGALYALMTFVAADYLTGVFAAIVRKELSSEIGAKGILKKAAIFIIVGVGNLADIHLLGNGSMLRTALIFFYAANELVSLTENCAAIGLPVPQFLRDALAQLKKKSGEKPTDGKDGNDHESS